MSNTLDIPTTPILTLQESVSKPRFDFSSLLKNKLLLLGIFGVVMLVLAITTQLASREQSTPTDVTQEQASVDTTGAETATLTANWPLYEDPYNSYKLKVPPNWIAGVNTNNIESAHAFELPDGASLNISVTKSLANSVESHLEGLDAARSTAWQGRPSRVVTTTSVIRIGNYDGFERSEVISATGVEYLVSYIMIDEDVFTFTLLPKAGEKSVGNKELIRQVHLAETTFAITNQAERLGEWKTYSSTKVESLSFPSYSISFPATWGISENKGDGSLALTISRNGYKVTLNQAAVGGAVCLFKDSPTFQGSSGDLRAKDYTEYKTDQGYVLRRYFKGNEGDNSVFLFCGKEEADQYFTTPLALGGLTYTVPAKFDVGVIAEMDNIVKSLQKN
jgi:hypothetical protein